MAVQLASKPTTRRSPVARIRHATPTSLAIGGALLLSIATIVQSGANFLFHGVVSRSMSPGDYAALATLLGLTIMLTVPLGSLQAAVTRSVANDPHADVTPVLRRIVVGAIAVSAVVFVVAVPLRGFLHLPSVGITMLLAPFLLQATVLAAARGAFIGQRRFHPVAWTIVLATVLRLLGGAVLSPRYGVAGAMWATLAAEIIGLGVLVVLLPRRTLPADAHRRPLELRFLELGMAGAVVIGLWLFTSIDMLLARHFLAPAGGDAYVAASTLARCVMAVPVAIVMASMPGFASAESHAIAKERLRKAGRMVGAVAAVSALALVLVPNLLIGLLFGSEITSAALVATLGCIAAVSSFVTMLTYFHLARRRSAALIPWLGAALEATLIVAFHGSAAQIAIGSAISMVPTVLALGLATRRDRAEERSFTALLDPAEPTVIHGPADPDVDLSVVIPFYNPGDSVGTTVRRTVDLLRAEGVGFEIIAVSDGSTDGSEAHVSAVDAPEVHLVVQPQNRGKGAAVRRGMAEARGHWVAFIDADGDIDPVHLVDYLRRARAGGHDMVYASKRHEESGSASSGLRKIISWGYSTFVSSLFRLGVNDTQTGAKLLRRHLASDLVRHARECRFALDLELFVIARRLGHRDLVAAPVHLGERLAGSTVTVKAILRTLRDSLVIWGRLHGTDAYPAKVATVHALPTRIAAADLDGALQAA